MGADEFLDTDQDGLPDKWESDNGLDPEDADTDNDGLTDGDEVNTYGTDPADVDTEGDGMPDGWDAEHNLDPLMDDANDDDDEDGFSNIIEYRRGTDPQDPTSYPPITMPWLPLLLKD